jgi:hypothetical protein
MSIKFPEGKDKLLVFEITMKPDEGIYRCFLLISVTPTRPCMPYPRALGVFTQAEPSCQALHVQEVLFQCMPACACVAAGMYYSKLPAKHEQQPGLSFLCCGRGGCFSFSFNVSPGYPHEPPKVKCKTKVRCCCALSLLSALQPGVSFWPAIHHPSSLSKDSTAAFS